FGEQNITYKCCSNFLIHLCFEQALKPITVGLVLVSAWLIADASAQNMFLIAIVVFTAAMGLVKKIHPLWIMICGAGLGVVFLGS
ncbi:hypothetical protein ABW55_13330, partial [Acinetobacter sp. C15]